MKIFELRGKSSDLSSILFWILVYSPRDFCCRGQTNIIIIITIIIIIFFFALVTFIPEG